MLMTENFIRELRVELVATDVHQGIADSCYNLGIFPKEWPQFIKSDINTNVLRVLGDVNNLGREIFLI